MKRFKVVTRQDEMSEKIASYIIKQLVQNELIVDMDTPELIISIGGDGTFLYSVHTHLDILDDVCFMGIHTGTLGFFTQYTMQELDECIADILYKKPSIYSSSLIEVEIEGKTTEKVYAVNEARIENVVKTQIMTVHINKEELEVFRGTGLCISTQYGSTAYNRSINGAVVQRGLEVLQLTEIAGIHHRAYRSLNSPIILRSDAEIELESKSFEDAMLGYDHKIKSISEAKKITCKLSDKKVHVARYRKDDFVKKLKNLF